MGTLFIDKVRAIVLKNVSNDQFTVGELASELGLSKSQTLRKVKAAANKSVNQYIRELRLEEAAKLILETDQSIAEISYEVGFSSPSYFTKSFSKYYGMAPGEYKTQRAIIGELKATQGKSTFFEKIWQKKIPHVLIAYMLFAWIGLQILDWALVQFSGSPNWSKVFLVVIIGLLPSLLVYLNNRERIHEKHLNQAEKILFPTNFVLVAVALFFMFKSVDLGAISKSITYVNTEGEEETHEIIKPEYKKHFPVFPFEPMTANDTTNHWLGLGAPITLSYLLNQDRYLNVVQHLLNGNKASEGSYYTTVEKIELSRKYRSNFYVDGKYQFSDGKHVMMPAVKNKINGNIIHEKTFTSSDFFAVTDSVVAFLRHAVGLTQSQIDESLVLRFDEVVTSRNIEPLKAYASALYQWERLPIRKAAEMDTTWLTPSIWILDWTIFYSEGELESKILVDRVMRHMNNLPFEEQIGIRIRKHLAYKEWGKAEQLLKLQLEIEPDNDQYNFLLSDLYFKNFDIDKYIVQAQKHYEKNPGLATGKRAVLAALVNRKPEEIISTIQPLLDRDPKLIWALEFLTEAYLHQENYDRAEETINKIILINPDLELNFVKSLEAVNYLKSASNPKAHLPKFIGAYRSDASEMTIRARMIGNNIHIKAEYQPGHFLYPADSQSVQKGVTGRGHRKELIFNDQDEVIALKGVENFGSREKTFYYWKQDSTIWNAETLLKKGLYNDAFQSYNTAIAAHPDHYYLKKHLQHLEYLRTHTKEEVQGNLKRVTGVHNGARFWVENDLLHIQLPGYTRRILRPLSDNQFITLSEYLRMYEFIQENNKVIGVRGYLHDFETGEWIPSRDLSLRHLIG